LGGEVSPNKNFMRARDQCLMSVILATQEAEIWRVVVRSQPRQIVHKPYLEKNPPQNRAGGMAQDVGPEFKPQHCKKKKSSRDFPSQTIAGHSGMYLSSQLWYRV
jgi:hypothetical protein